MEIKIPEYFLISTKNTPFPDVELALKEPNGLVAVGGELSTNRLLNAYSNGIFPWYTEGEPILWYSPNPRMIATKDSLHISKSLKKIIKSNIFEIRINTNFSKVINSCKYIKRKNQTNTWINKDIVIAYNRLNKEGYAKSIEVYQDNDLVGGLYGIAINKVFFGESMFSYVSNASKIAFVYLLKNTNYLLVDCQVENPYLKSLGAFNIERKSFIKLLKKLIND
jgi:leucyl/phenylalanyl-tRNA--protein transferase